MSNPSPKPLTSSTVTKATTAPDATAASITSTPVPYSRGTPPWLPYPPSQIKRQELKGSKLPRREPMTLTFLDEPDAGQSLDLGVQVV